MAYSTISEKYGLCVDCNDGIEKPIISNRCKSFHYKSYRASLMLAKQKEKNKLRSLIQSPKNIAILEEKGIVKDSDLELWYRMQMKSNERICDNCGKSLAHYNDWSWRSSQNHIVDKSHLNGCPSVATNPLNHNVLGMWCCHSQWGTSFLNQSKMPCFEAAKSKFQLFKHLIPQEQLRKINPHLLT